MATERDEPGGDGNTGGSSRRSTRATSAKTRAQGTEVGNAAMREQAHILDEDEKVMGGAVREKRAVKDHPVDFQRRDSRRLRSTRSGHEDDVNEDEDQDDNDGTTSSLESDNSGPTMSRHLYPSMRDDSRPARRSTRLVGSLTPLRLGTRGVVRTSSCAIHVLAMQVAMHATP